MNETLSSDIFFSLKTAGTKWRRQTYNGMSLEPSKKLGERGSVRYEKAAFYTQAAALCRHNCRGHPAFVRHAFLPLCLRHAGCGALRVGVLVLLVL